MCYVKQTDRCDVKSNNNMIMQSNSVVYLATGIYDITQSVYL